MLLAGSLAAGAQINSSLPAGSLTRAEAMLADDNYVGCADQLSSLDLSRLSLADRETAAWLLARANAGISPQRGVASLKQFLARYAASIHRMEARMLLGNCLLDADPQGALDQYDMVDPAALTEEGRGELAYRRGCALLALGELDGA